MIRWPGWLRWPGRRAAAPEDRRPLDGLRRGFLAIDIETTGLDPGRDAIVAVAAVPFIDGQPTEGFETLVNPERPIPPESIRIHGITDAMVAPAPTIGEALAELDRVWGAHVVVGHGVAFDLAVLDRARRAHVRPVPANPALCTMRLAAALHPGWTNVSLESLGARLGVPVVGRHTARGDALTAGALMLELLPDLVGRGHRTVADALWLQRAGPRRA